MEGLDIMDKTYELTVAGCKRNLPICKINDELSIAAFIMFGDVELTKKSAQQLLKKCPDFDIILTAEAKGIPLCYEMAAQANKPYLVARKAIKLYLIDPVEVEVKSITTANVQKLYLSKEDSKLMQGKKVLVVDDVISTGESLAALEKLAAKSQAEVVGKVAVLAEGDAIDRKDIIYLETLPIIKNK